MSRATRYLLTSLGLTSILGSAVSGCESKESTPTRTNAVEQTNNTSGGNNTSNETDTDTDTEETVEIVVETEAQALAVLNRSCYFLGCHASSENLLDSPTVVDLLRNKDMPPQNQSRYTLRDDRRAALISYLENRRLEPDE